MARRLQAARSAGHRDALPVAVGTLAGPRRAGLVVVHIDADEQVQTAVAVVVDECCAGVPDGTRRRRVVDQAGLLRHIGERAVAVIAVQRVVAPVGDEQVGVAVVVVVRGGDALRPTRALQPGLLRDVGERAVLVVAVQPVGRLGGRVLEARAGRDEDVQPAVVVVVDERNAAGGRFGDELHPFLVAEDDRRGESGLPGDVRQGRRPGFAGKLGSRLRLDAARRHALGQQGGAHDEEQQTETGHITPTLHHKCCSFFELNSRLLHADSIRSTLRVCRRHEDS